MTTNETQIEDHPLPPGPDGYPLIGNSLDVVRRPFEFTANLVEYGDVSRFRAGGNTYVSIRDPDHVQQILVEDFDTVERYLHTDQGVDFATEGVLFVGGDTWRRQRKIMQPAFTIDRIQRFGDRMVEEALETRSDWSDGQTLVLNEAFKDLTVRILTRTLFDLGVTEDTTVLQQAMDEIHERANPSQTLLGFIPGRIPTPSRRRYQRTMEECRQWLDELIASHQQDTLGEDLLSMLLEASEDGESLSNEEIRDNLLTLLFAGHETTTLALTYTFLELAKNPEAQRRLQTEVDEVVGTDRPAFEHVPDLEYVEAVIREGMRLYPPAYILFREALEPMVLDGYRVPAGSILSIPTIHLHRDERYWAHAEQFRPERWLEAEGDDEEERGEQGVFDSDRSEDAYVPFAAGPRHCIGMRFAMLEMKLVVATIAQHYSMEVQRTPEPELKPRITLQPGADIVVRLERRE